MKVMVPLFSLLVLFAASGPLYAETGSWADLNGQVVSCYKQAQYAQAVEMGRLAVKNAEAAYGPDHPNVAISLNNLGAVYLSMGQYDKAEPLLQRALAVDEKIFGKEHPNSVADRANLNQLYALKGQKPIATAKAASTEPASSAAGSPSEGKSVSVPPGPGKDLVRWDAPYEEWKRAGYASEQPKAKPASDRWLTADLEFETGYRLDQLRWNIAGNLTGGGPNIISELTWTDLQMYELKGRAKLVCRDLFVARARYAYGWIYEGSNQDSDYLFDNKVGEFSRSNNASKDGTAQDATLGIGYPFRPLTDYEIRLSPMGGYSYHEQNLTITNGRQTIPDTGTFNGLDSEYRARWEGPWVGLDAELKAHEKMKYFGSVEYHWARYEGRARWNLRSDFQQPLSFRHRSTGNGVVGSFGFAYPLSDRWSLTCDMDVQFWWAGRGINTFFLATGTTHDQQLNEVKWQSFAVNAGANYSF